MNLLRNPFDEHPKQQRYAGNIPYLAGSILLSCLS